MKPKVITKQLFQEQTADAKLKGNNGETSEELLKLKKDGVAFFHKCTEAQFKEVKNSVSYVNRLHKKYAGVNLHIRTVNTNKIDKLDYPKDVYVYYAVSNRKPSKPKK